MEETQAPAVVLNEPEERWQIERDGQVAFLAYMRHDDLLYLVHTEVPPEMKGGSLASRMVRTAMDFARDHALTVIPFCPFARSYLERHRKDYEELVRWD
ncbi:MAG: acetyltransferase [Gemmatimonadetes bacterium]|nr:acetyltransferase [Gemmatimonadota bacterium]